MLKIFIKKADIYASEHVWKLFRVVNILLIRKLRRESFFESPIIEAPETEIFVKKLPKYVERRRLPDILFHNEISPDYIQKRIAWKRHKIKGPGETFPTSQSHHFLFPDNPRSRRGCRWLASEIL